MRRFGLAAMAALFLAGLSGVAHAQERQRGDFDPAQFRQRMMDRIKEQLGASDEEFKVLQPKIEKVMDTQRNAQTGGGGMGFLFGGRGGGRDGGGRGGDRGPGGGDRPQSALGKAASDLRTALENKDTPAADIAAKLTALRDARAKAREELAASQKELKELLTAKQEAMLVVAGMLE